MGRSTEGIAIPADKPHWAMTRVGFRGCGTLWGGSSRQGDSEGKQERVTGIAGEQKPDVICV